MNNRITLREWIVKYNSGDFNSKSRNIQCDAGWFDWFCSDAALVNRLKKMGNIIKDITNDFILDNYYIWFKNNCPCVGKLYDDFRFEPMNRSDRDKLYFGVACDDSRNEHRYEVFTARNGCKTEFSADNKKELINIINSLGDELRIS